MTEAQPAAAAAPAATAEVPQTFKVFAGNLAFATTDEGLNAFFSKAGEVLDAHVVTRGMRSMGYGFVDFATLELAEKAVSELNKQELDGRTINVELARAREEGSRAEGGEGAPRSSAPRRRGRGRGRGRGGFRGPSSGASGSAAPAAAAGGAAPYQHQGGYRGYRGGNYEQGQGNYYNASSAPAPYYEGYAYYPSYQGGAPRGGARAPRPGRRARQQEGDEEQPAEQQQKGEEVAHQEGGEGQRGGRRQGRGGFRRGRGRGPRSEGGAPAPADDAPDSDVPAGEFRGRGRRRGRGGRRFERRPRDENQAPSATTLFIANLPYEMDEEGLLEVFKDYQPKQARIARANGRSKGFGFVQLETQELQQKAAAEIDNTEVQGRILNVKPAVVDLSVQQPEPEAEATQSEAQPAKQ